MLPTREETEKSSRVSAGVDASSVPGLSLIWGWLASCTEAGGSLLLLDADALVGSLRRVRGETAVLPFRFC